MALKIGSKAPDFMLLSDKGQRWNFYDQVEKSCIIYFYPKDFTPGCTAEACSFRDKYGHFQDMEIPVIGISRDSVQSHMAFKKEHRLPFTLLADPNGSVAELYDAAIPFIPMTRRISYFISEDKFIISTYTNFFRAEAHIKEMLRAIK